jgi:hypothetical protein
MSEKIGILHNKLFEKITLFINFFFLWVLKSKVYFNRPNNLEDLRQRIRAETEQISPVIIERSVQSVGEC